MGKSNSKLRPDEISELQRSTHFTNRELQQWYKGFLMDYPNGLSLTDFQRIFRQYYPFGDPDDFAKYIFYLCDGDKNGIVDYKEFILALHVSARGSTKDKLVWTFQLFDSDKDGYISKPDMLTVVHSIYKMIGNLHQWDEEENTPEKRVDKLFKSIGEDEYIDLFTFCENGGKDPIVLEAIDLYSGIL